MVAVNIITHGSEDGWLRPANNQGHGWYTLDIVGELSDVDTLIGKPKLFFINACRGSKFNSIQSFLSPPVHFARWTQMRCFVSSALSVCLSVCPDLTKNQTG